MYNKSDEQFIITESAIEANNQEIKANKQDSDEKMMELTEYSKAILVAVTDQINTFKSLPNHKDSPNPLYPTTVVPDNRRDPPLDGG